MNQDYRSSHSQQKGGNQVVEESLLQYLLEESPENKPKPARREQRSHSPIQLRSVPQVSINEIKSFFSEHRNSLEDNLRRYSELCEGFDKKIEMIRIEENRILQKYSQTPSQLIREETIHQSRDFQEKAAVIQRLIYHKGEEEVRLSPDLEVKLAKIQSQLKQYEAKFEEEIDQVNSPVELGRTCKQIVDEGMVAEWEAFMGSRVQGAGRQLLGMLSQLDILNEKLNEEMRESIDARIHSLQLERQQTKQYFMS